MQDEYGDKGLTIIGVTSEGAGLTDKWVEQKGARYGYAYDKSSKLMRQLGVSGYPSAVLVDPSGNIAWKGHPGSLRGADIEGTLSGALPKPLWEWPRSATGVRKAVQKGQLAKALKEARKLKEPEEMVSIVTAMIDGQIAALNEAKERGDFLKAYGLSSSLKKSLKGLPEEDTVKAVYEEIKDDKGAQEVIKAQKGLQKLVKQSMELKKKRAAEKLIGKCRKVMEQHPGTYVAEEADALLEGIRKLLPTLK